MKKNISSDKYLNIGCSANDGYAQHLGVMIYSLLRNCSVSKNVKFFIVDSGISKENKEKLNSVIKSFNAKVEYQKPDMNMLSGLKKVRYLGIETYLRFSLIENIKVDKLLYLDCDMIIEGDINELFEIDMGNNLFLAAEDPLINDKRKEFLGFSKDSLYFNAGLLLINCKKWKKQKINEKVIDFIRKNPDKLDSGDQDGLNAVLHDKFKEIPISWNYVARTIIYKKISFLLNKEFKKKLNRVPNEIKLIHYAGYPKPWFFWRIIPFKKNYFKYLRQTPWKDYKYPDANVSGFIREFNLLIKTYYLKIRKGNIL